MLRHTSRTSAIAVAIAVALGLTLTVAATPVAAADTSVQKQSRPDARDDRTDRTEHADRTDRIDRAARTDANGRYTAEEIRRFLVSFYGKHGPSAWEREHQVSAELKKKAAETPDHDLLLCAQNTPRDISVGKVTTAQSARVGWATITTYWSGDRKEQFTAYVDLDATRPIELLDVACSV
ncbi:hypothetical protein [Streptomyces sp. NPDC018045]|uniref:hypothetical protein n=1 Tax=Streptomyces sp. NPDC018045 TaxID=3365037 RepID=UPI0037BAB407